MGKRNYLVEGGSGSGKSSVCRELRRRGFHAINGDQELSYQGDPVTGEPVAGLTGTAVHDHHIWRADVVEDLVADHSHPVTFFCGGSRNIDQLLGLFDGVFVLDIDLNTLHARLDQRSEGEWGGRPVEREQVVRLHRTGEDVPPGVLIDATAPLSMVVDEILRLAAVSPPPGPG